VEGAPLFWDRTDAGQQLADQLTSRGVRAAVVLALPRGGVPVALPVALALSAALDVFVVRKLGVPGQEELAFGAIASGGVRVLNRSVIDSLGLPATMIDRIAAREGHELMRREALYRSGRAPIDPRGREAILVDDGLATGASMLAAVRALRQLNPERVNVAVPVASQEAYEHLRDEVDDLVVLATPDPFLSVGIWYERFYQTTDQEVQSILETARQTGGAQDAGSSRGG
jgi:predicted phosphoribosyltransferase